MYGIFIYRCIYHTCQPNVGKYSIDSAHLGNKYQTKVESHPFESRPIRPVLHAYLSIELRHLLNTNDLHLQTNMF